MRRFPGLPARSAGRRLSRRADELECSRSRPKGGTAVVFVFARKVFMHLAHNVVAYTALFIALARGPASKGRCTRCIPP